jgi:hypothetical protein
VLHNPPATPADTPLDAALRAAVSRATDSDARDWLSRLLRRGERAEGTVGNGRVMAKRRRT